MPLALQIELLSRAEIDQIWKARGRAENFADYLNFINAREIGDGFRIPVEKGDNNAAAAKEIRHNFTEAAKERTRNGTPAPVLLKWSTEKHNAKKTVKKDGKTVEEEFVVIDKVAAVLVATDSVKKRGPRTPKVAEPTTNGTTTDTTVSTETVAAAAS